jgi:hypothetical protein
MWGGRVLLGMRNTTMWAKPLIKTSTIVFVLALTAMTYACGDDDDDAESSDGSTATGEAPGAGASNATTSAPSTTAAEPGTTAAPVTTAATSVPGTPAATVPSDPACDPFGTLEPHELNDRCVPDSSELGPAFAGSDMAWHGSAACPDLVAVPNELIVAVAPTLELLPEADSVIDELDQLGIDASISGDPLANQAIVLSLVDATIDAVQTVLPDLQRIGRSVDLNYLEPLQPNNAFRPFDDPISVDEPQDANFGGADGVSVMVIDSPDDPTTYDMDGNGLVDEDHGHGVFVQSIIGRSGATVSLVGVPPTSFTANNPSVLASGRWAPMMFSDAEIIAALGTPDIKADVVNLSLGGVGCLATATAQELGDRLALARVMDNMRLGDDSLQFVAAAGNNGLDVLHFPAAWRHPDVTAGLTDAIRNSSNLDPLDAAAIADDITAMHDGLGAVIYAVGSVESSDRSTSEYSNCGVWVNAVAFGSKQAGAYATSPTGFASWSGTSFATANFTAALASNVVGPDSSNPDQITGAYLTGPTGLACRQ